ncbi:hypothetical protein [Streptomyces sp. Act143]|uniref:hypothetical protein n=1 Tax=Streptomyces sp. Act143 TaxID=2200760 RepID=UPI0015E7FB97|nr:hypothetical protein [Streptomyces sp. Act143]
MTEILQTIVGIAAVGSFLVLPAAVVARHQVETHPERPAQPEDIDAWGGEAA